MKLGKMKNSEFSIFFIISLLDYQIKILPIGRINGFSISNSTSSFVHVFLGHFYEFFLFPNQIGENEWIIA